MYVHWSARCIVHTVLGSFKRDFIKGNHVGCLVSKYRMYDRHDANTCSCNTYGLNCYSCTKFSYDSATLIACSRVTVPAFRCFMLHYF